MDSHESFDEYDIRSGFGGGEGLVGCEGVRGTDECIYAEENEDGFEDVGEEAEGFAECYGGGVVCVVSLRVSMQVELENCEVSCL